MIFDPENPVMKLCAEGIGEEGHGHHAEAAALYQRAWEQADNNLEKFTAAHYVARQQNSVKNKLLWDQLALEYAMRLDSKTIQGALPSLYLNIAKCFEDLGEKEKALQQYREAETHGAALPDDGYGKLIRGGIQAGILRMSNDLNTRTTLE